MVDHQIDKFNSITFGNNLDIDNVLAVVDGYIRQENSAYKITVGSDSELVGEKKAHFVIAIVVHRVGHGAIYFWGEVTKSGIGSLRQRIYEEATYSLSLAQCLLDKFKDLNLPLEKLLEIHVDIGEIGETRVLINEVVGMVRGSGFTCYTKPFSFAASNVADRHT